MARVNPIVLSQIFNTGANAGSPAAAFLVGRKIKEDRESQEVINELRKAQTANLLAPKGSGSNFRTLTREEKIARGIPEESFAQIDEKTGKVSIDDPPRTDPLVTVNTSEERAFDKEFGKNVATRAGERNQQAMATFKNDQDLTRIELAIARGAQTGIGEETLLDIKGLGSTLFGIKFSPEDQESEVIRKISNELALQMRNPASGLGLTGSTSNKDLDFLRASVAGLQRSEAGNLKIIELAKRQNQFKRDVAAEQSRLIASNVKPSEIETRLMDFVNSYEFFSESERKEIERLAEEGAKSESVVERAASLLTDDAMESKYPGFKDLTPEQQQLIRDAEK